MSMHEDPVTPPRRVTPLDTPSINRRTVLRFPLNEQQVAALVRSALEEDGAFNDVTTIATVLSDRRARAHAWWRASSGVIAGLALAIEAFHQLDRQGVHSRGCRGRHTRGAWRHGAVPLGTCTRLVVRRAGGVELPAASVGRRDAHRALRRRGAGTRARILDTRKTTPGWRALEKYAVRCGRRGEPPPRPVVVGAHQGQPPRSGRGRSSASPSARARPRAARRHASRWSATTLAQVQAGARRRRRHHPARQHVARRWRECVALVERGRSSRRRAG